MAADEEYLVTALVKRWSPVPNHAAEIVQRGGNVCYFPDMRPVGPTKMKVLANRLLPSRLQFQPTYAKPYSYALDEFKPDLAIVSFGDLFQRTPVLDYLLERRIPYITNIQLVSECSHRDDDFLDRQINYLDNALLNCFLSRKNIALAEQLLGSRIPNTSLIRNPCSEVPRYVPYPSTDDGFKLAFPARLHTLHKGLDILLKVMAQEKWMERRLTVNCFGDGPNRKQLKRLKSMWAVENVNFLPFTDDISGIWESHHGLIMSSRMEGQPLVALEAMSCGRMVITVNVGLGDELITHHENGFIARAATVEELDAALEDAWNMRERWEAMGNIALSTVKEFLKTDPVSDFINLVASRL